MGVWERRMAEERSTPLRPRDPRSLGQYELVGRLGEGGMGTVYLARSGGGTLVAVKMIRADLAHDDEFRRRFRSEVERVRQVPPFCTAEVLDADPDHEHPYLVVEYVDGPSLADVVEERGPLTSANLHSVAIGVATALTAIHGAGIIHRDLKPRNVLLAPGSPKVIDFGIARAMEGATGHTAADQMVGTVAYMAPERFDDALLLTPAADVFAWGGVVAFAGTGRTPFNAGSPPATAARILTGQPDLSGLGGPLRDLVAHALEKNPAHRPTARELLDLLVTGPQDSGSSPAAAALAHQPGLRVAAAEAQAATEHHTGRQVTALAPARELVGYSEDSIVTHPLPDGPALPPSPFGRDPHPRRPWVLPLAVALLVMSLLAVGGVVLSFWSGTDPTGGYTGSSPVTDPFLRDALSGPRLWQESQDKDEQAGCTFDDNLGALVVRRETSGVYRCRGPADAEPDDIQADVDIRLLTKDSCAAVWMRFEDNRGYQVRFCERNVYVSTHKGPRIDVLRTFPLDDAPITIGAPPTSISVTAAGSTLEVLRDGATIGTVELTDPDIAGGQVVLGIFTERYAKNRGPYEVAFSDIALWHLA